MIATLSAGLDNASTEQSTPSPDSEATASGSKIRRAVRVSTSTTSIEGENQALQLAKAAFEYRDFAKVIETLDDWIHPPRISNPITMLMARELLGVALHVTGNEKSAREEFAQLLLIDPSHQLDPFLVPPDIVATFEDVRRQLEPRLKPRVPVRLTPLDNANNATKIHRAVAWLPFGVPQFVLKQEVTGVLFASAQLLGLGVNIAAFLYGESLLENPNTSDSSDIWLGMQYGGLSLFLLAYGTSVAHGHTLINQYETQDSRAPMAPWGSRRRLSEFPAGYPFIQALKTERAIFGPSLRFRF